MDDTSPEIAAMVRRLLLARPGPERLAMGCQMFEVARTMVLASLPPGLSDFESKIRLCERLYGDQVNVAAFAGRLRHPGES
jgi:hypothetical protein